MSSGGSRVFLRLLGYTRPYAVIVALVLLLAAVAAGGRYVRAYLMKPVLDDVLLPSQTMRADGAQWEWLPELGAGPAEPSREDPSAGGPAPEAAAPTELGHAETRRRVAESFRTVILVGLLVVLVMPLAQFGHEYLVAYVLGRVQFDLKQHLCAKLLALPLRFHHGRQRGDILTRALTDAELAQVGLRLILSSLLPAAAMIIMGTALLLAISWQLTLVSLVTTPALIVILALFGRRIAHTARRRQEKVGDVTQRLVNILAGIKVIKAFRGEAVEQDAFRQETRQLFRRSMKVVKHRVLSRSLVEVLNNGIGIAVLLIGVAIVLQGQWGLSPGDLAAFAATMATTYRPLKTLSKEWSNLADSGASGQRFFDLLDTPVDVTDATDGLQLDGVREGIRFSGVSFSYGREPVLRDVSLEVPAGQVVAIVGRTGAGKSTLADLLLRFHDPDSGTIEIDGIDIRRISRESLLDHLAVVTQEPFLFGGSVRDNIRYARQDATDEEILTAARAAHVDEFVDQLPNGYDTEVGDLGVKLSGGQRQRITIARAILKNPSILIFDEATSSLDAKSERYVQDAIAKLLAGRTVLVITHRLSTIRHADRIVILEDGVVTRSGTHEALMGEPGLYPELVGLQAEPG